MKLSEAMRLGAMALPAMHGPLFDWDADDKPCAACAIGAALYAANCVRRGDRGILGDHTARVNYIWPWTEREVCRPCGCLQGSPCGVVLAIIHLFEICGWTRERIADWIATIEPAEDGAAAVAPAAEFVQK